MLGIILYVTVLASNGRQIGRCQWFPAETWDDHPDAHAAFIDLYIKHHCEAFARKENVTIDPSTYRIWWRRTPEQVVAQ